MLFDSAPRHKNTDEKPVSVPVAPVSKENVFLAQEKELAQELSRLERDLASVTQQIGAMKQQMSMGKYPGMLTDLADLTTKKDSLTAQINNHPKFAKPAIKDNFTGRDARLDKYTMN